MPIPEQRDLEAARGILAQWLARTARARPTSRSGPSAARRSPASRTRRCSSTRRGPQDGERPHRGARRAGEADARTPCSSSPTSSRQYQVLEMLGTPHRRAGAGHALVRGRRRRGSARRSSSWTTSTDAAPGRQPAVHDRGLAARRSRHPSSGARSSRAGSRRWRRSTPSTGARSASTSSTSRSTAARLRAAAPLLRGRVRVGGRRATEQPTVGRGPRLGPRAHAPADDPEITVCWGDARINNQLFDDDYHVAAVVDWEMVTLADPMMDLGWWLFLDRHFHEGTGARRAWRASRPARRWSRYYEQVSGRTARDLEFYEVFAGFRFAVVMMRITSLLVEFELMPPRQSTWRPRTTSRHPRRRRAARAPVAR